ncbi:hypothetical protein CRD36_05635 [Paremcibacter congregatus]|uniref:Uncharacterized protein n=1 Tax=Paremcibacter congregatus TaxID=2043170 RepID=A0A2G4YUY6_9PROT|nr:hypothetical protein CRD36_05635 [Paremcibacter congregatus]
MSMDPSAEAGMTRVVSKRREMRIIIYDLNVEKHAMFTTNNYNYGGEVWQRKILKIHCLLRHLPDYFRLEKMQIMKEALRRYTWHHYQL